MADQATAAPSAAPTNPTTTAAAPGVPGAKATDPAGAAPPASPPAEQFFDVKINGRPQRLTLQQLQSYASLAAGAHERFEQAAAKERQLREQEEELKRDPFGNLAKRLGLDPRQYRQQLERYYKEKYIDPETMNEDQRRAYLAEQALKEEREKRENEEKTRSEQQRELQKQQGIQQLQEYIIGILDKHPDLPKTRFTVSRMAYWMQQNNRRGYNAPPEVLAQQVRDEYNGITSAGYESIKSDPDKVADYIVRHYGEDVLKALRKADMRKLKQRLNPETPTEVPPADPQLPANRRTGQKSMRDVDAYFNELRRSKR